MGNWVILITRRLDLRQTANHTRNKIFVRNSRLADIRGLRHHLTRINWVEEGESIIAGQISEGEVLDPLIVDQFGSPGEVHPLIGGQVRQVTLSGQSKHVITGHIRH